MPEVYHLTGYFMPLSDKLLAAVPSTSLRTGPGGVRLRNPAPH